MIKAAGVNNYKELIVSPNSKSSEPFQLDCTYPPAKVPIDVSSLLSFSLFKDHTVWITNDGIAHAVGSNKNGRISKNLKEGILDDIVDFGMTDINGNQLKLKSALCCECSTLYLAEPNNSNEHSQLIDVHKKNNGGEPIYIDIGNREPIGLFGNIDTAIVVDSDGSLIIINEFVLNSDNHRPQFLDIPNCEKVVSVACCINHLIVVTSVGRIYASTISNQDDGGVFSSLIEIKELSGLFFKQVSGCGSCCHAVTRDNKVYGCIFENPEKDGLPLFNLGNGEESKATNKFVLIDKLSPYKIVASYDGSSSYFQTDDGKILSCGINFSGELLLSKPSFESVTTPTLACVESGVTFCIAGKMKSAVFINCPPPRYCPNQLLSFQ